ncbi:MAG: hypothetical protein WCI72_03235 [archaeon]
MQNSRWLVFLLFVLVLVGFVSALDTGAIDKQFNSVDARVQNITSQVENTQKTLTNQEVRDAFLKQRLTAILENKTGFKEVIAGYRKVSPYTTPTLEYIVGMAPELSLFFILVLVIWFFLVKYIFTIYEVLRDVTTFSQGASLAISFCVFGVLTILQFFQSVSIFLANKIVGLIDLYMDSTILKVLMWVIFIVAIIFLSKFSKEVKIFARYLRAQKYKRKKESEEEDRNSRQESATRKVETYVRAITED